MIHQNQNSFTCSLKGETSVSSQSKDSMFIEMEGKGQQELLQQAATHKEPSSHLQKNMETISTSEESLVNMVYDV